jgi:DNA-binding NarL/FixJ family response regulator
VGPIRVHFGPMPEMLRSIISDLLSHEPDIAIVGHSSQQDECLNAARKEHAAIIVAQDAEDAGSTCLDLILAEAPLAVLALSADGHSAARVSLVRRPITLDSESPSVLANAIRRVAAELAAAPVEARELNTSRREAHHE